MLYHMNRSKFIFAIFILFGCFGLSCTFTTSRTKNPEFRITADSLVINLNKLVTCKHYNLDGTEKKTNGKISDELEIDIINGRDIPSADDPMKALGKSIASEVKLALKRPDEYMIYKVLFVKQTASAGITVNSYKSVAFKTEEIQ